MIIKEIIEHTGHKVFIINSLNGGVEYQDLALILKSKGCNISVNKLHCYHTTLKNYDTSQQTKPIQSSGGKTGASKETLTNLVVIDHISEMNALKGLKMLRSLFFRQLEICHKLQTDFIQDNMVIMNNELKNLATIKAMYFEAVKIGLNQFQNLDSDLSVNNTSTPNKFKVANAFQMV